MRKIYFQSMCKAGLIALLVFFLSGINSNILSQEQYLMPGYDEHMLPAEKVNNLKSGEEVMGSSWTTAYNINGWRSDYFTFFRWSDLTWHCDCDHSYNIKFYAGGVTYPLGTFTVTSYSEWNAAVPLGPSSSGTFTYRADESGHNNVLFLGCWGSCTGAAWYNNTPRTYSSTARPRTPTNLTATQGKYQHRIDLSWSTDTDIPAGYRVWHIYRDGVRIDNGTVTGNTTNYYDETLDPNETHSYAVYLNYNGSGTAGHTSYAATATGTTFDLDLNATTDEPAGVYLTWEDMSAKKGKGNASLDHYQLDRYDTDKDMTTTVDDDISATSTNKPDESAGLIPGYMYKYTLIPYPTTAFFPDTAWGKKLANGRITGKVLSPTLQPVTDVSVCAVRQDPVPQDTTTVYCAMTDTSGKFDIKHIYYYEGASFKVTPYREDHGFDPASRISTIDLQYPSEDLPFFMDTSAFTAWGQVVLPHAQGNCPIEGVGIYVNEAGDPEPDTVNPVTTTDKEGKFAFSVGQIGDYVIKPGMEGHSFDPGESTYHIDSDTNLAVFEDTTRFLLTGVVKASCDSYIGQAELKITAGEGLDMCYDSVIWTDTLTGYYEIELPARTYHVSIYKFHSEDATVEDEDVELYFPPMEADLTFGDQELNFFYRSKPNLIITGFNDYGCGDYENIPIITQGTRYTLILEVREAFGVNECPADTGYIIVQNHLGNETEVVDTLYLDGGVAEYKFIPGDPNLIAPHTKDLTVTAYVENEWVSQSIDVLVEGNRPREQTFTTVSPEIPLMILRDPPGDGSYSYLEEGTTTQTSLRFSAQQSGSVNIWGEVKAGTKFEAGFGVTVETEIWGKVRGALEVGASITGQGEFTLNISNGEKFSTSGNQDIIGEGGDVFIGSALNLIYALTDVVAYDPETCGVNKLVNLSMGIDGFATTFMYTGGHIRNNLIPNLAYIRDYYDATDNDSADFYANQIDVWNQTLKLNEDLKEQSINPENYTLSAGVDYESFSEVSTTRAASLEFSVYIEASVALEAGIEVGGVGASGGVETKLRTEIGSSMSWSETVSRKTGFFLSDDDEGDDFSMEVREDRVYGTPVFKLISGRSSCPWEPGSLPREGVQLTSDTYVQFVDDPDGQAVFKLRLGNISQNDEDRIYYLVFDQASNPDGAVLTLGGSQVQDPKPFYVLWDDFAQALVTVERGPEAFDYNNLQFTLFSGCDDDQIRDTVFLDVHFENSCSPISLTKPSPNWVLSSVDDNKLKIRVQDYDRELLDHIGIQIARKGIFNWQTVALFSKEDLEWDQTDETIQLTEFEDGEYDMRVLLECSSGRVYSDIVPGLIDRKAPELFGLPEPSDLVFDAGDMIYVIFDEPVNCYKISSDNVTVTNLSTGETASAAAGCQDRMVMIIPDLRGTSFEDDTFNIQLSGIEDLYGNSREDPVSWSFIIKADPIPAEDEDTDLDGILNGSDNCPFSANVDQADMDEDGQGDVCDPDVDGDGVANLTDNCLMTENPDQEDLNGDGIGDACQDFTGQAPMIHSEGFYFSENYPNPFSGKTTVNYILPSESQVIMKVMDIVGNEVDILVYQRQPAGNYEVTWDASGFSDGIYFCSIYAESVTSNDVAWKTIKMVLSK